MILKPDFSKYTYVFDDYYHNPKILRFGEEDVTEQVMNNPLLDLMMAYSNLAKKYDMAEKLLGAAIQDFRIAMRKYRCDVCKYQYDSCNCGNCEWRRADEAFELIRKRCERND